MACSRLSLTAVSPKSAYGWRLAQPQNVILRLFIQRGLAISIAGASAGILAALATTRALASYLHDVSPSNPAIFGAVAILLLAVALFASYLPSRRAAKIEPLRALRHE